MKSEVMIDKWNEPIYYKELDLIKNMRFYHKLFYCSMWLLFSPTYSIMSGIRDRYVVKVLNTDNGEVRIIKQKIEGKK